MLIACVFDYDLQVSDFTLPKPKSGRIAVKVTNHLSDEVTKVMRV